MDAPSVVPHDTSTWQRCFETNRGTHWTVGGTVAVIIFGSYFTYNNYNRSPAAATTVPVAEQTQVPIAAALLEKV
jgi:hypothetical protein